MMSQPQSQLVGVSGGLWFNGQSPSSTPSCGSVSSHSSVTPSLSTFLPRQVMDSAQHYSVSDKSSIIQCPNPSHNPLANHAIQQELNKERKQRAQSVEEMEERLQVQAELILRLQTQNQALSVQLRS